MEPFRRHLVPVSIFTHLLIHPLTAVIPCDDELAEQWPLIRPQSRRSNSLLIVRRRPVNLPVEFPESRFNLSFRTRWPPKREEQWRGQAAEISRSVEPLEIQDDKISTAVSKGLPVTRAPCLRLSRYTRVLSLGGD